MTTPTGCDGERITAYVDGALAPEPRAEVESHLAACPECRDQEAFERSLRERMRALPPPELPRDLQDRVRRHLRRRPTPALVRWLPLAAGIVLALLWGRGAAPFVAWEVARDHEHCFGAQQLAAEVWSSDAGELSEWYRQHGTEVPLVPSAAAGVELVGGRFCPLMDRKAAHLFYAADKRHLSLYVVPGPARFTSGYATRWRGESVRLVRSGGLTLAIVGEDGETVEAFQRALTVSRAEADRLTPRGGL